MAWPSGSSGSVVARLDCRGVEIRGRADNTARIGSTVVCAGMDCVAGPSMRRFALSRRRSRLMYEVRLVIPRLIPASSSSHFRMLFMLCPAASAASISGQSALICPAFVAGFSARRCARRLRATTIQVADFSVLCVSGKKKPLQITAQKAFFGQLFSRSNWAGQRDRKQRMEEPRGPAGSEEHSCGDLRRFATNRGGFPASRQFAMSHDVLRQTRQPRPMRRGNKDPVVEHKGLWDGPVFFHSPRVRGQQVRLWDKPVSVSDDCPTPESL